MQDSVRYNLFSAFSNLLHVSTECTKMAASIGACLSEREVDKGTCNKILARTQALIQLLQSVHETLQQAQSDGD